MGTTGDTSRTRGAVSQLEGDRLTKYAQPQEEQNFFPALHPDQNGMIQITMTCDDGDIINVDAGVGSWRRESKRTNR